MTTSGKIEKIKIAKVTLNMGVGDSSEKLQKAEKLLKELSSGQKPIRTFARATIPELSVKKHSPIGVKVTMRGKKAIDFLARAIEAVENKVNRANFDKEGNLSFGVKEYIELPNAKYDPDIGMFGFEVCVNVERPGYRISRRKIAQRKIPVSKRITQDESIKFFEANFKIKVE